VTGVDWRIKMSFPKHEASKKSKGSKKRQLTLADMQAESSAPFVDMSCVAEAIEGFGRIFSTWVTQEREGDNGSSLYTTPKGYPVKVALMSPDGEDEAFHSLEIEFGGPIAHSIADSLKRIADAMQAKP
jgi:hypothetical protein